MRLKGFSYVSMVVLVFICIQSVVMVFADIPTVLEFKREKVGADNILNLEIRHSSPSSSHYVDIIEVEIDGKVQKVNDLEHQTSTTFTYKYNLGKSQPAQLRVRAHCNIHGWSQWRSEEKEEGGRGIPGFPYVSIILGIVFGVIILWILQRRQ